MQVQRESSTEGKGHVTARQVESQKYIHSYIYTYIHMYPACQLLPSECSEDLIRAHIHIHIHSISSDWDFRRVYRMSYSTSVSS